MEGGTTTMATLLTAVTDIFEAAVGWAGTVGQTIVETPVLLMFVLIPIVGLGIGIFKRLINVH